jgi:hypothetical protein
MSRYEFSFVVTEVELSEEQQRRVARAVALAGAVELNAALPPQAVTAPVESEDLYLRRYWCGIPPVIEFPPGVETLGQD